LVIYQRFLNDDHPLDDYPSRYVPAAEDMPLTILTEVTSLYPGRGTNGKTEALVAVGTSVLGPKPHHLPDSVGWGTVDPRPPFQWHQGWAVQRADRESAVLTYENENQANLLQCGQRVKIKPGDAASASAHFGWYFVVDSSRLDRGDEIVDIFVRWKD
jgi:D-serine deaminase-like pyridoxal phosphate-dependent protein